ncbi:hypothetical protein M445_19650 [Vibrio owensii 47666-1]|nr:hypothetical protein M445_19650 [Vibrio owensii 47666-1]KIP69890.1 hypothetical protein SN11_18255 [Vibrio harveyi]
MKQLNHYTKCFSHNIESQLHIGSLKKALREIVRTVIFRNSLASLMWRSEVAETFGITPTDSEKYDLKFVHTPNEHDLILFRQIIFGRENAHT